MQAVRSPVCENPEILGGNVYFFSYLGTTTIFIAADIPKLAQRGQLRLSRRQWELILQSTTKMYLEITICTHIKHGWL